MPRGVVAGSKRGKYRKSDPEAKRRILEAAERQEDWQTVARNNGISISTARKVVITRTVTTKHRGGKRNAKVKMTQVMLDFVLRLLEANSQITLKEIRERIENEFGISISNTCIAKNLQSETWTVKKITNEPVGVNTEINKERRAKFVRDISECMREGKTIVYQDETNLNLFTQRTCGRAPRGQRAKRTLPNCKGPNVHCIGIYSQIGGLKYWERCRGSMTKERFRQWFTRMLARLKLVVAPDKLVIVIDNAPCHSGIEDFLAETEPLSGIKIVRLGPYSAPLSPIEMFWSVFKASAKRRLAGQATLLTSPPPQHLTQTEHRLQILENVIDDAIAEANENPENPIR